MEKIEIIIGKTAGFCYGVKRAVDGAKNELKKNNRLYGLGEIVHNQQVIQELENLGMKFVENIESAKGRAIIRAHGVPKEVYEKAKKRDIELIDYTCENVLKIHRIADEYSKKGFYIFLLGTKKHPEILGIISHCGKNNSIIEGENDILNAINNFKKSNIKKLLVIAQTTYNLQKFDKMKKIIQDELSNTSEIVFENTICKATQMRQTETENIAKKVNYMIIIGGKNSSNTKKLYDIAKKNCKNAICIETEEEVNLTNLKGIKKVGVMAGASTPPESIQKIIKKLRKIDIS